MDDWPRMTMGDERTSRARPIVPYGRSFREYCLMFALSGENANTRIIGIGDGPSDFNAQATAHGWRVISVDPVYRWPKADLEQHCYAGMDQMLEAIALAPTHWTWAHHSSVDALRAYRVQTARNFLQDFASPASAGRYIAAALPALPFRSGAFDVAVCSHFLFNWSTVIGLEFHTQSVLEMLRIADEVRIFPTGRNLSTRRSRYATAVCDAAIARGYRACFRNIQPARTDASSECLTISRVAVRTVDLLEA